MEARSELDLQKVIERLRDKARRKVPEAEVEDLVQEVLLVLVQRLRAGHVEALQAYAEGILRNMIYDFYQRRRERLSSLEGCELESHEPSPEQRVVWMRHLRVIDGLAEENKVDQALLENHFVKGEPLREVASGLGVSPGAVNGRLYRFRQKVLQRVGSCFAFLFALLAGLWGRLGRAYAQAPTYAKAAGLASAFVFGTYFFVQLQEQASPAHTPQAIQTTAQLPPAARAAIRTLPQTGLLGVLPTTAKKDKRKLWVTGGLLGTPTTGRALVWKNPQRAPQRTTKARSLGLQNLSTVWIPPTRVAQKRAAFRVATATVRTAAPSTAQEGSTNAQAAPQRNNNVVFAGFGGVAPSSATALAPTRQAPVRNILPSVPSGRTSVGTSGSSTASSSSTKSTAQHNNTSTNNSTNNASKKPGHKLVHPGLQTPVIPRAADGSILHPTGTRPTTGQTNAPASRSFCVVQDGRLYSCTNGVMEDISINANYPFGCGQDALCQQMIGKGPSLVFTRDGLLLLVGEGFFRQSNDGGATWSKPVLNPTPNIVLKEAFLVLSQSGAIWRASSPGWQSLRMSQPNVHEVRVHLQDGQLRFEDDAGFQTGVAWKDLRSRTAESKTPLVKANQVKKSVDKQLDKNTGQKIPNISVDSENKGDVLSNPLR